MATSFNRERFWRRCAVLLMAWLGLTVGAAHAEDEAGMPRRSSLRERMAERQLTREAAAPAGTAAVGRQLLQLKVDGLTRKAVVHVPAGYDASRGMPLLLAFHGGGGHAEHMADDTHYGLISMSERHGFIIAFPNGYSRLPGGRFATWNAGGCCGDARDRKVDDVAFARALVQRVAQQWRIDPRRVYATGMSNGGMMSHRLACEAADVFAAVASVAGTDATERCAPSRPIAVLHIHARDDSHVLFEGGAGQDAFRDSSKVMDFVSVPETMKRWAARDSCSATPRRILDKPGAYCERWSPCAGQGEVQLCVTEEGGHSWPGAPSVRRGKAAASTALDGNELIWDFLSRHTL